MDLEDLFILGVVGFMAVVVINNWSACMYNNVLIDAHGNQLGPNQPCNPPDTCTIKQIWQPNLACALNPFRGGGFL